LFTKKPPFFSTERMLREFFSFYLECMKRLKSVLESSIDKIQLDRDTKRYFIVQYQIEIERKEICKKVRVCLS
jgi:hypothetical protein